MCVKIIKDIDAKYKIDRDQYLTFTQLVEEIGELAKEINTPRLRNKEIDYENLKGEFADVILQVFILAKMLNIDVEEAVKYKVEILKNKHKI